MTDWRPFGLTWEQPGDEIVVLYRDQIEIVRRVDGYWRHRGPMFGKGFAESVIHGDGAAYWAALDTIPVRGGEPVGRWSAIETAPQDGTPFFWLHYVHHVGGGPPYDRPRLTAMWREGCWRTSYGGSEPDHYVKHGWWSVDALPISAAYLKAERLAENARLTALYNEREAQKNRDT